MARAWVALLGLEVRTGQPYHTVLRLRVEHPELHSPELAERLSAQLGRSISAGGLRQALQRRATGTWDSSSRRWRVRSSRRRRTSWSRSSATWACWSNAGRREAARPTRLAADTHTHARPTSVPVTGDLRCTLPWVSGTTLRVAGCMLGGRRWNSKSSGPRSFCRADRPDTMRTASGPARRASKAWRPDGRPQLPEMQPRCHAADRAAPGACRWGSPCCRCAGPRPRPPSSAGWGAGMGMGGKALPVRFQASSPTPRARSRSRWRRGSISATAMAGRTSRSSSARRWRTARSSRPS